MDAKAGEGRPFLGSHRAISSKARRHQLDVDAVDLLPQSQPPLFRIGGGGAWSYCGLNYIAVLGGGCEAAAFTLRAWAFSALRFVRTRFLRLLSLA